MTDSGALPDGGGGDAGTPDAGTGDGGAPDSGTRDGGASAHLEGTTTTAFSSAAAEDADKLAGAAMSFGVNTLGINDPRALYQFTQNGPIRYDVSGTNARHPPTPQFYQYSYGGGAYANPPPTGGFIGWTSHSTGGGSGIGAFDEADGSGRVLQPGVNDSNINVQGMCSWCSIFTAAAIQGAGNLVQLSPGGAMGYGQQLDLNSTGACISNGPCGLQVIKVGIKYVAYVTDGAAGAGVTLADVTNSTGSTAPPFLPVASTGAGVVGWYPLVLGHTGSAIEYVFTKSASGVVAEQVQPDGTLVDAGSFASSSFIPATALYRAGLGRYWVFSIGYLSGVGGTPGVAIDVLEYDPGASTFTSAGTIPAPPGAHFIALRIAGSTKPIAVAVTQDSAGARAFAFIDLAPLSTHTTYPSPLSAPALLLSLPSPNPALPLSSWEVLVQPTDPATAYLYLDDWTFSGAVPNLGLVTSTIHIDW